MIMEQSYVNLLQSGFLLLVGFLLSQLWGAVKDLQGSDKMLADKVAQLDLLVAGQYVKRSDLDTQIKQMGDAIFKKLDRIELKLDGKVDKQAVWPGQPTP